MSTKIACSRCKQHVRTLAVIIKGTAALISCEGCGRFNVVVELELLPFTSSYKELYSVVTEKRSGTQYCKEFTIDFLFLFQHIEIHRHNLMQLFEEIIPDLLLESLFTQSQTNVIILSPLDH